MGCGVMLSVIFVNLFGIRGIVREVILLSSSMPTAMNSLLLSEEFRVDPDIAASAVIITTVLSFVTIPLVLRYIL
jgi:predicted permease